MTKVITLKSLIKLQLHCIVIQVFIYCNVNLIYFICIHLEFFSVNFISYVFVHSFIYDKTFSSLSCFLVNSLLGNSKMSRQGLF